MTYVAFDRILKQGTVETPAFCMLLQSKKYENGPVWVRNGASGWTRSTKKDSKEDACRWKHVTAVAAISELDVEGTHEQKYVETWLT
jgi:hypothetical protein